MFKLLKRLVREEEGQGLAEYALILFLIAVVVVVALTPLGETIRNVFYDIEDELGGTGAPAS